MILCYHFLYGTIVSSTDVMPQDTLDQLMCETCSLLKSTSRDIIKASLSFLKACLVIFPPQVMSPHVETLVAALAGMKEDCQRKCRNKTRDILDRLLRKFGAEYITGEILFLKFFFIYIKNPFLISKII